MVNSRPPPPYRTQRALSMAAETKRARDALHISLDYPYSYPYPPSPSTIPPAHATSTTTTTTTSSSSSTSSTHPPLSPKSMFIGAEEYHLVSPRAIATLVEQKREAKHAQRQRREQIIAMLQQQQIDAQEKAKQEKLDKQQAKLERKQIRSEHKQMYQAQYDNRKQSKHSKDRQHQPEPPLSYAHGEEPLSSRGIDDNFSSTSSNSSRSTHSAPDRLRSLSLKSNTKSMYDLRPWSGCPQSPSQEPRPGYENDEHLPPRSPGWDSLMDTLYSPTLSSPPDLQSLQSLESYQEEPDLDLMDCMGSLSLSSDYSSNGNGKYLLVLGANGKSGIELVKQGLERNYRVTAFVRDDKPLLEDSSLRKNQNLLIVRGSPTSQADVDRCVEGQDVVVNVIGARLMANDTTISSHSQVILNNAMKKHGVRRLIVVTSYGCLGLRNYLINTRRLFSRMFMTGILKDKVLQEDIIQRDSEFFDWTIVRPITLKDGEFSGRYLVSADELPKTSKIKVLSRKDLSHYILSIINRREEYKAIRSIAGRSKSMASCTSGTIHSHSSSSLTSNGLHAIGAGSSSRPKFAQAHERR